MRPGQAIAAGPSSSSSSATFATSTGRTGREAATASAPHRECTAGPLRPRATTCHEPRRPRARGRAPGRRTTAGSRYSPLPLGHPEDRRMKRTLPRELDDLGGMRAARWFRESTAGQWDNFGPDAQREQQDRAIERYGPRRRRPRVVGGLLGLDLGLAHRHLGDDDLPRPRVVPSTSSSSATSAASCATSSRRSSRSRTISIPPVSSSSSPMSGCSPRTPASWDQFIREAHEAEAYSRKLSKRVSEGYAAKRRTARGPRRQQDALRPHPRGQALGPAGGRGAGRGRHPGVPARRLRLDRLGGGGTDRSRQDPRVARSSPTPSTPADCGPASPPPSRPSSTPRCGRPCRRDGSADGPGHRVAS